jgi:hypothetical protein
MKLYAYCLTDSPVALEEIVGLSGARPYLIWEDEFSAVVSDYAGDLVGATAENVFDHQRVVDHVLTQSTPLPFRFASLVSEPAIRSYIRSQEAGLRATFARVRDCVEMAVKVIWDSEAIRQIGSPVQGSNTSPLGSIGAGTAFLLAKQREILGDELLKSEAARIADWLSACVADYVKAEDVQVRPERPMVLTAAFLVERQNLTHYRYRLTLLQDERKDLRFLTSGPWAPYTFAKIALEKAGDSR